ncbi:PKD domain-containing protein [Amycolatopsis sp. WQ 127309]|uniref:PKD domain-containing protein n=1 Tax=Amycolatopsis sp. WQ 127309 TaxID=2932773 RepID=UPI001FF16CCC|nr:PKD domain-containing protein [Amycolatopsis sp. WQ 127309]UOZ05334.1 PKD domain-containing protein [Amycolatopsis sp. WQ 127309]
MKLSARPLLAGVAALTAVLLAPGVAHAAPPSNDDFGSATAVTALPFTASQDVTESTKAADDPAPCGTYTTWTVWYDYTAAADALVRVTPSSTGSTRPFVAVYTGDRGALTQVPGACATWSYPGTATFHATAGTTYHVMLAQQYNQGDLTVGFTTVPPAPNDDFAAAATAAVPGEYAGDLTVASAEPGEVAPSCDPDADRSVWFRFTPDRTRSVSALAMFDWGPGITVYRGTSADSLSEVDCVASGDRRAAVFTAVAGETYQIRVADDVDAASLFDIRLETAPPLAPFLNFYPNNPSVYTDVTLAPYSGDSLGRPFVSGEVRFGDGGSAPITGADIRHRYAADGEYRVEVTGTTADGRTGTGFDTLKVDTHDVALSDFTVPATARVDQTKPIKVSVANTRHDETVTVTLYRLDEQGYDQEIGHLKQWVPAAAGRKVVFPFAYTYTAADAAAGRTSFKVVATIENVYSGDARPEDNQLLASTTVRAKNAVAMS